MTLHEEEVGAGRQGGTMKDGREETKERGREGRREEGIEGERRIREEAITLLTSGSREDDVY